MIKKKKKKFFFKKIKLQTLKCNCNNSKNAIQHFKNTLFFKIIL